jgi:tRNA isopentenyl-2-thiomethyl-A-37 hydroxylase MiaE
MEQQEVLYVKTLGNQTKEIVFGLRKEDPSIDIKIVHESLEGVCFVLKKISKDSIDIKKLCDNILNEEPIHYRTYWQVNVGARKPIKKEKASEYIEKQDKPELKAISNNESTAKIHPLSLAWRIL